jgi:DMSO/TMAO reductase YedYZ molybdopterin-dependent catalytic subunit
MMNARRTFLKLGLKLLAAAAFLSGGILSGARWVWAKSERVILPKGTRRESIVQRDPKTLDARNLDITELKDFETMGLSDHETDVTQWRLEVGGLVKRPLELTYDEILGMPSVEKNVLLICPGIFANHGKWKGVSMKALLEHVGVQREARLVSFSGPKAAQEKVERFPVEEVVSGQVFLAYGVNGQTLPRKHGFPLRVVAEDYYGDDWVKYVCKMTFEKG